MKSNFDLRGARAKLDAASGGASAADAALKPVVSASGAAAAQGGSSEQRFDSRGAGLTASWELDVWGRLRAQSGAAQAQYEGAALDYEFARQSIAAGAAKAWFIASETLQQQTLADQQVATIEDMSRVIDARRAAGKVGEQDSRLVKAELAAAEERQRAAQSAHKQSTRALEAILGRYPSAELQAAPQFPPVPAAVSAGVPSEILERRPDVAAVERNVNAAFKNVEAKTLARLPQLSLTARAGAASLGGSFFNVGANFFAPIFDGGARKAEVKIPTAQQESTLVAYGQTALRAFTDVENALESDEALAQREALLTSVVKTNEDAYRLRKIEADIGKADTLGLLQLQSKVNSAKSGLISLRQARRSERVNLHVALGGSFQSSRD